MKLSLVTTLIHKHTAVFQLNKPVVVDKSNKCGQRQLREGEGEGLKKLAEGVKSTTVLCEIQCEKMEHKQVKRRKPLLFTEANNSGERQEESLYASH